jgi:cbb3-type cytochrome oxidase subunit 1
MPCHVRLFAPKLAWVVAIGWQIGVAVGVASLLMGYTSTKEYAEFEWRSQRHCVHTTIARSHLEHPHTLYKIETNYKGLLSCGL